VSPINHLLHILLLAGGKQQNAEALFPDFSKSGMTHILRVSYYCCGYGLLGGGG
jgi:hypothetical protein